MSDAHFPETGWTAIRRCQGASGDERRELLEELVSLYWSPVHAYVRRHAGVDDHESRDLTQSFFVRFIDEAFLRTVDADRGRFRGFLAAALRRFLIDQHRHRTAGRRRPEGGLVGLDDAPEPIAGDEGAPGVDPEFDLEWKRWLIEVSVRRLRAEAEGSPTKSVFVELLVERDLVATDTPPSYGDLARTHDLPVSQIRNGLTWARRRFGSILRLEVARRSASDEDFRQEAREMFGLDLD